MNQNLITLSFSMEANKGVYALLLGSGVSRAAQIPTGWGVLKALIDRVQALYDEEHEDSMFWFEEKFGEEPRYDRVLEMLARTQTERQGLMNEFFQPSIEDKEAGIKIPTLAHQNIAKLVKKGYIRIIISTNFDRLMEESLEAEGVNYQTIYHQSDIQGIKPLEHSDCTVFKIHGDYKDIRFLNVTNELEKYPDEYNELLDKIFENYGLIISGWSGEWDTALKKAIKRTQSRRFSWYWHALTTNDISEGAKEIISFREAMRIFDDKGANHFFKELHENVTNIKKLKQESPATIEMKLSRLKKYIHTNDEINIRELITEETKRIANEIEQIDYDQEINEHILEAHLNKLKELSRPLVSLIAVLVHYQKTNYQRDLVFETLERLTFNKVISGDGRLIDSKLLPLYLVFEAAGISSVKNKNYNFIEDMFVQPQNRAKNQSFETFKWTISLQPIMERLFRYIYKNTRKLLPFETLFLYPYMKEIMVETRIVFDDREQEIYQDIFDFLKSLKSSYHEDYQYFSGSFGHKMKTEHIEDFLKDIANKRQQWSGLVLFNNKIEKFEIALKQSVKDLNEQSNFSGNSFLKAYEKAKA